MYFDELVPPPRSGVDQWIRDMRDRVLRDSSVPAQVWDQRNLLIANSLVPNPNVGWSNPPSLSREDILQIHAYMNMAGRRETRVDPEFWGRDILGESVAGAQQAYAQNLDEQMMRALTENEPVDPGMQRLIATMNASREVRAVYTEAEICSRIKEKIHNNVHMPGVRNPLHITVQVDPERTNVEAGVVHLNVGITIPFDNLKVSLKLNSVKKEDAIDKRQRILGGILRRRAALQTSVPGRD